MFLGLWPEFTVTCLFKQIKLLLHRTVHEQKIADIVQECHNANNSCLAQWLSTKNYLWLYSEVKNMLMSTLLFKFTTNPVISIIS
jgi:hypothetical protein